MIRGSVSANREPIVQIIVRGADGQDLTCDAIVDTGFTGWLTLPPHLIAGLNLLWFELGVATLADGSQITFDVYRGEVLWDGQAVAISIDEADSPPLIGMRLTQNFRILNENVNGGLVELEQI